MTNSQDAIDEGEVVSYDQQCYMGKQRINWVLLTAYVHIILSFAAQLSSCPLYKYLLES